MFCYYLRADCAVCQVSLYLIGVYLVDALDYLAVDCGDAVTSLQQEHGVHGFDVLLCDCEAVTFVLQACLQDVAQALCLHGEV